MEEEEKPAAMAAAPVTAAATTKLLMNTLAMSEALLEDQRALNTGKGRSTRTSFRGSPALVGADPFSTET